METFNRVTEPMELEFFSIEPDGKGGKQIHIHGYLYTNGEDLCGGTWRNVEYSFFIVPLQEFIERYREDSDYVEQTACELKQYIGDHTDAEVLDIINSYYNGKPADYLMEYCEIDMATPCGNYCFEF